MMLRRFVLLPVEEVEGERDEELQSPSADDPQHPPVVGRGQPVHDGQEGTCHGPDDDLLGELAGGPTAFGVCFGGVGGADLFSVGFHAVGGFHFFLFLVCRAISVPDLGSVLCCKCKPVYFINQIFRRKN